MIEIGKNRRFFNSFSHETTALCWCLQVLDVYDLEKKKANDVILCYLA